jgi:hypothetical protein
MVVADGVRSVAASVPKQTSDATDQTDSIDTSASQLYEDFKLQTVVPSAIHDATHRWIIFSDLHVKGASVL